MSMPQYILNPDQVWLVPELNFKQDLPPPYRENEEVHVENRGALQQIDQQIEVLDLLANCKIEASNSDTDVEYAEICEDMGIWHSTPLTKRHKSKISLTWVLKENLENKRPMPEVSHKNTFDKYQHHIQLIDNERRRRRVKSRERIVGRSEHYHLRPNDNNKQKYHSEHNLKHSEYRSKSSSRKSDHEIQRSKYHNDNEIHIKNQSGSDGIDQSRYHRGKYQNNNDIYIINQSGDEVIDKTRSMQRLKYHNDNDIYIKSQSARDVMEESFSDDTSGEEFRKKPKHRHRKKKRRSNGKFGYDITDLDCFLSEASIDRPGNIPVVIAYPTSLYQTHNGSQRELPLPLGTVVNAVFKSKHWVYAQTPHGEEGYVGYNACLPLGILPNRTPQKKTPCWESSTDIYPRPCGNLTDNEKEQLRGRSKSECKYRPIRDKRRNYAKSCAEKNFDDLYLKTKSYQSIDKLYDDFGVRKCSFKKVEVRRQMLLVVNQDYKGSDLDRTLSVKQGEVVVLVEKRGNDEWFYVKKRDGFEGFIPAAVAGNGYI